MPLDPLPIPIPCSCFCLSLHFFTSLPPPFPHAPPSLFRCDFLAVPASTWRHFSASTLLRPFIHSIVTVRTCTRSSPHLPSPRLFIHSLTPSLYQCCCLCLSIYWSHFLSHAAPFSMSLCQLIVSCAKPEPKSI